MIKTSDNRYDCVLYDFDGTLGDTVPLILSSFEETYIEVLGECKRTREDFKRYIGLPLTKTFEMHDADTSRKLLDAYLRINCAHLANNEVKLFDGVLDELYKLKEMGITQGIVTSKRRSSLMITIELLGLQDVFEIIVVNEDTDKHKPDAEPILFASRQLGIPVDRMMYVGDAKGDIQCAINAKCDSVFVEWSEMPKEPIMELGPTYIIKEINELSCIIKAREL